MKVYFIGAGPGAADLITVRAKMVIERAPVIMYAGSLVPEGLLDHALSSAERHNTAGMNLEEIIDLFKAAAACNQDVARLHSGDPSLWSAITEQISALKAAGIAYEIIPGVPAFTAAAAAMGRELTQPEMNQTVILTRTEGRASKMPPKEDLANLGAIGSTLVIHLSAKNSKIISKKLIPHYGADCPARIAANVSTENEQIIATSLGALEESMKIHGIERTAIIFVGPALSGDGKTRSALYASTHARHLKP